MPNGLRATPGRFWSTFSVSPCVPAMVRISSTSSAWTLTSRRGRSPRTTDSYGS